MPWDNTETSDFTRDKEAEVEIAKSLKSLNDKRRKEKERENDIWKRIKKEL